jgi:glutathione synthase
VTRHDVLFVIDPVAQLSPTADSTYVMVTEALRRGHRPYGVELGGLSLHADVARASAFPLALTDDARHTTAAPLVASGPAEPRELRSFAAVVMRKDPPVDAGFLTATWILEHAGPHTVVVNRPAGLRNLNEKLAIARVPQVTPRTFVARDPALLREILAELGGRMIVKPVFGYGGREILMARADDPNLGSILELATADGSRYTVAQEFLPRAHEGDKRILLVDGVAIGAVLRVPKTGELRNNFHAGGSAQPTTLDARDEAIVAALAPILRDEGIFFAGIDVIAGHLTEVNVTSPTGMQEINRLGDLQGDRTMQAKFWDGLLAHIERARA